jgi:hypothetical protein
MPYVQANGNLKLNGLVGDAKGPSHIESAPAPLDHDAIYSVNAKALRRWASERLRLEPRDDGSIDAIFHYEGTTCTNLGRPLAFDYRVTLGPPPLGYPIRHQRCCPAPHDTGHMHMCRYLTDADDLLSAIEHQQPLLGRPLNDVLTWNPPACTAGCYCEPGDRTHKWRLVLQTIHYALVQLERQHANGAAPPAPLP